MLMAALMLCKENDQCRWRLQTLLGLCSCCALNFGDTRPSRRCSRHSSCRNVFCRLVCSRILMFHYAAQMLRPQKLQWSPTWVLIQYAGSCQGLASWCICNPPLRNHAAFMLRIVRIHIDLSVLDVGASRRRQPLTASVLSSV